MPTSKGLVEMAAGGVARKTLAKPGGKEGPKAQPRDVGHVLNGREDRGSGSALLFQRPKRPKIQNPGRGRKEGDEGNGDGGRGRGRGRRCKPT